MSRDVSDQHEDQPGEIPTRVGERVPLTRGLSMKLLVLTVLFITLAEMLIFLPSLANFRLSWLEERLSTAAAVGVVLVESDPDSLSREVQDELLRGLGAMALAVRDEGSSSLLVAVDMPHGIDLHVDLGGVSPLGEMHEALYALFFGGERVLRVFAPFAAGEREFELVMSEAGLRKAMLAYARNVALLSLILSLMTATLVFYAIHRVMIRPMRAMTRSMLSFAEAPDDPARIVAASERRDEIGVAERELAAILPRQPLTRLPREHVVYKAFYLCDGSEGRVTVERGLDAITVDQRAAVLYAHNDLLGAYARDGAGNHRFVPQPGGERQRQMTFRLGVNIVMYALCLDYKEDQVHVPFIMRRRRWRVD